MPYGPKPAMMREKGAFISCASSLHPGVCVSHSHRGDASTGSGLLECTAQGHTLTRVSTARFALAWLAIPCAQIAPQYSNVEGLVASAMGAVAANDGPGPGQE